MGADSILLLNRFKHRHINRLKTHTDNWEKDDYEMTGDFDTLLKNIALRMFWKRKQNLWWNASDKVQYIWDSNILLLSLTSLEFMKMISEATFCFCRTEQIKGDPFFFIVVQEIFSLFPRFPWMAHLHKVTRKIRVILHVALNRQPTSEKHGYNIANHT